MDKRGRKASFGIALVHDSREATLLKTFWQGVEYRMASSSHQCALQVKKEKKNENLARYYRLQDEVRAHDPFRTLPQALANCIPVGFLMDLTSPIMLQDGAAAGGGEEDPTANSKATAQKPAKESKQAPAAAPPLSELPDREQKQAKLPKASRLISSTHKQKPITEAEPPSESDAEAGLHSEADSESAEEEDEAEAEASKRWARMRGLAGSESSSEDEDASDSDTDAELPAGVDDEEVKPVAQGH